MNISYILILIIILCTLIITIFISSNNNITRYYVEHVEKTEVCLKIFNCYTNYELILNNNGKIIKINSNKEYKVGDFIYL